MTDGPEETIHIAVPIAFPERADWRQPRGWRHRLARIRQPVLAWIVAAAVLGGFALWGIAGSGSGFGSGSGSGSGGSTGSAKSLVPLPAMVPAPAATSSPSDPAAAGKRRPSRRPATTAAGQPAPGQSAKEHVPSSASAARPTAHPSPQSSPPRSSPRPRNNIPTVVVRYFVDSVSGARFQGEVDVVNNGRRPLAGWQIVVALEGDEVTAVQNASGFDSNGILLMQPATSTEVVPADGGTLRVFFTALGPRTIPLACAFNQVNCQ